MEKANEMQSFLNNYNVQTSVYNKETDCFTSNTSTDRSLSPVFAFFFSLYSPMERRILLLTPVLPQWQLS